MVFMLMHGTSPLLREFCRCQRVFRINLIHRLNALRVQLVPYSLQQSRLYHNCVIVLLCASYFKFYSSCQHRFLNSIKTLVYYLFSVVNLLTPIRSFILYLPRGSVQQNLKSGQLSPVMRAYFKLYALSLVLSTPITQVAFFDSLVCQVELSFEFRLRLTCWRDPDKFADSC